MNRIRPGLIICLTLILFFALALLLRTIPPYDKVFTDAGIRFTTVDAYYQMYIVDNLAHNFPKLTASLPYLNYPNSMETGPIHFFNWLLAAVIWIIGMGKPTQHLVDVVGVYYPAVLGALTVIPVYFIGKALAGRWAGIIGAALIAILPGEFLGRSILGSTDQHVAESLFSSFAMLFMILALKTARQRQLTYGHFKNGDWATIVKPVILSLLAGFFLGIYMLTWVNGALLFIFITSLYFVIQFIIDHLRGESTDYLSLVGLALFLVAAVMILPVMHNGLYLVMAVVWLVPLLLNGISRLMTKRQLKPGYFPSAVVGLGLIGLAVLYLVTPSLFRSMIDAFTVFFHPTGASLTTLEMQPIFSPNGSFTLDLVWGNFTTSLFLGLLGLLILIVNPKSVKSWIAFFIILAVWVSLFVVGQHASEVISILISILTITGLLVCLIIRQKDSDKSLIVVWSLVMLEATIGQRRFGYYLAVNAAVLTGFLSAWVIEQCGLVKSKSRNENALLAITMGVIAILFLIPLLTKGFSQSLSIEQFFSPLAWIGIISLIAFFVALYWDQGKQTREEVKVRRVTRPESQSRININPAYVYPALALIMLFLIVLFPNIGPARETAKGATFAPPDAWMESLTWMKANTPEPFADPEHYYQLEAIGTPYPASAYGVLSWWDYGYWITRIAHRIPNVNPSQDSVRQNEVATIFTSQNETTANEIARKLGSAYVIIDDQTALGKFWAVATWAGKPPAEFSEVYIIPQGNQASQVQLFYPEYYRSLAIRLYNFDGKAVTTNQTGSNQTFVIAYEERKTNDGQSFKLITSAQSFATYEEAETFRVSKNSTRYRIVSPNPFVSPVPLEAVTDYKLVYSSSQTLDGTISSVKIFEFTDNKTSP
ncbi:MAG: oligosaccharyl transferase, archaeosortase A system-associated [Dehalococcoidales bacterium]|nr:oligosaccharyl transferase, archaeosortase A system-associated [Dehalococcoidales bacterium]